MVTGNASNDATQQRNAQVHVLQNFAAGFRSQAKTTTGPASSSGYSIPPAIEGCITWIGSEQNDGGVRWTGVIVPAGGNPTLFGRQWLCRFLQPRPSADRGSSFHNLLFQVRSGEADQCHRTVPIEGAPEPNILMASTADSPMACFLPRPASRSCSNSLPVMSGSSAGLRSHSS